VTARRRLDTEMVRRGLVGNRTAAREMVNQGRVTVDGAQAIKAARLVDPAQAIGLSGPPPRYVSRGGTKLEAALDRFGIDVVGRRAVDVGAGTGGFTDCLLQRGVASVVAVDVGRAQLHERLRSDPRVEVCERTDVRELDPGAMGAPFGVVVADLSFISLRTVMIDLLGLVDAESSMVLLVKPQFEAGRADADRGRGVIRDPEVRRRALKEVHQSVCSHGAAIMEGMESPISGAKGNLEYLVHVVLGGTHPGFDPAALVIGSPGAGRVGAP